MPFSDRRRHEEENPAENFYINQIPFIFKTKIFEGLKAFHGDKSPLPQQIASVL